MAIIYNTNYIENMNSYLTLAVVEAAKELWGEDNVELASNITLLSLAAKGEHEVLLCIDGQRTDFELMRRLRPCFKTMIFWAFEDPFMLDFNVKVTSNFDYVFTNDPSCIDAYQVDASFLPLAASPSIHLRSIKPPASLDYDIFFAGTMWPNRVDTLRHIIIAFPYARFKLICPTNEHLPPLPKDLRERVISRPVNIESFIDFANASRVTVTMFRNYASHGNVGQATAPGPRLYELALSGTAQVVEIPSEMDEQFINNIPGISSVTRTEDLVESIAHILEDPDFRQKKALASQENVLKYHTYKNRLKNIETITQANFQKTRTETNNVSARGSEKKLSVLFVTHSTVHENVWGGIEVYQQMLSTSLNKHVEFFYWLRRRGACTLTNANGKEIERFDMPDVGWLDSMNDLSEESVFSSVISQYGFDIVHFQHLGHHTLSLPIIAKACGVGVVFSFHDYMLICSHYNLLNYEHRFCRIDEYHIGACDVCLRISEKLESGVQQTRRAFISKVIKSIDVGLFGTHYSSVISKQLYPVLREKQNYILGIPTPEKALPITMKEYKPLNGRKLRIATVGNFIRSKGADTIYQIIQSANPNLFEFHIFGYMQPDYENAFKEIKKNNVIIHGSYSLGEVEALKIADVALILSIWPETYCISLSEAWQNGLIPIVTDVGGLRDRVQDGINGFKVEIGSVNTVIDRLELIRSDERLRSSIMSNIGPELWIEAVDYAKHLYDIYLNLAPKKNFGLSDLRWDVGRLGFIPHASWKEQAPPRHILDPSNESRLSIELPIPVDNWAVIQGANYYIDDICYHILNAKNEVKFVPKDEFHIRGWFTLQSFSNAGSLLAVLIAQNSDLTIFLDCQRENREDVASSFANAPVRNGFSGQTALRGKWCEGIFRVGLVNVVNGSAAFQLTQYEIEVAEGKVVKVYNKFHSNQCILEDFNRIIRKDGLMRSIKLNNFFDTNICGQYYGELEYCIEKLSDFISDDEVLDEDTINAKNIISISGWAYNRNNYLAGNMYVAFVREDMKDCFLSATYRYVRKETEEIFKNAPLSNGFEVSLDLNKGFYKENNGKYYLVLVNIVRKEYKIVSLNIMLDIHNNSVEAINDCNLTEAILSQIEYTVEGKLIN